MDGWVGRRKYTFLTCLSSISVSSPDLSPYGRMNAAHENDPELETFYSRNMTRHVCWLTKSHETMMGHGIHRALSAPRPRYKKKKKKKKHAVGRRLARTLLLIQLHSQVSTADESPKRQNIFSSSASFLFLHHHHPSFPG